VVITVVSGLPGSHKNNLGTTLVHTNKEGGRCLTTELLMFSIIRIIIMESWKHNNHSSLCLSTLRWVVYQPDPDSSDGFSAPHLQHFLSNFLESQRATVPKPRLLLVTPG